MSSLQGTHYGLALAAPHPTSLPELVFMVLKAAVVIGLGAMAIGGIVIVLSWMFSSLRNFLLSCVVLIVMYLGFFYWVRPTFLAH